MEGDFKLAAASEGQSSHNMSVHMPLLGLNVLVALLNKIGASFGSPNNNQPLPGDVQELFRAVNAGTKVAPGLHSVIRSILQRQQVSDEAIVAHLAGIKSLQRYDYSFKKIWTFCKAKNFDMSTASTAELAAQLQLMNSYFPSEGKNVYAALLKIPGWDQLAFHPVLKSCKRAWQKSAQNMPHSGIRNQQYENWQGKPRIGEM